jgi:hypothetical protein
MTENSEDKKLFNDNPEEYYRRLYQAKATLLSKGFKIKDVEGASLSECEDRLKRMFVIRLPYDSRWKVIDDPCMPCDIFNVNGKEFKVPEEKK